MIGKLRLRFTLIAAMALTLAMVLVVGAVNLANFLNVRRELKNTLSLIAENAEPGKPMGQGKDMPGRSRHERNMISEANWYTVYYSRAGEIMNMNLSSMSEADESSARQMAESACAIDGRSGTIGELMFLKRYEGDSLRSITFLNCETRYRSLRMLGLFSALACLGCILLALAIVALLSLRAVMPTIRNIERQKQFITNASHELKTPITVITTNMELMEMESPGSPWVQGTLKQAGILKNLVEELVYLSRMEEENAPLTMERLRLDELAREVSEPFAAMAEFKGLRFETEFSEASIDGDRASLARLLSILCDNAVKYAFGEEPIRLRVKREGRSAVLTLSNGVEKALDEQECAELFQRFYRADPSRSKEKQSGFGIGLAIAAAVVEKHKGSIAAHMEAERRIAFTVLLPLRSAAVLKQD